MKNFNVAMVILHATSVNVAVGNFFERTVKCSLLAHRVLNVMFSFDVADVFRCCKSIFF